MKPESDDLVLTSRDHTLYDAGSLTTTWKDEPREVLERLRRKNVAFPQARSAIDGLLAEMDHRARVVAAKDDRKQQEDRHQESYTQADALVERQLEHDRSLHRSTQRLARWAIFLSIGSVVLSVLFYLFPRSANEPNLRISYLPSVAPEPKTSPKPDLPLSRPQLEPSATSPGDALLPIPPSKLTPEPAQEPQPVAGQEGAKPPDR